MTRQAVDVAIVGGGIVGLATALRLLERSPDLRITLLEQEASVGAHQTGHNSGVLHAGLYYPPGSLKARLCLAGKTALERFAERHGIPFQRCGKLVVALDESELPRLEAIRARAEANGVPGLEMLDGAGIREREPHAAGIRALWSPTTGIIDFGQVAAAMASEIRRLGGHVLTRCTVRRIVSSARETVLLTSRGPLVAGHAIACAGMGADRLARASGEPDRGRMIPFRGDYYTLAPGARELVSGLIYPVPDPGFPFLGVHLTRRVDGAVWAGPNAVLAFARNGYRRRDVDLGDLAETLTDRGFLRLAARYWRTGVAEMVRDWSKRAFVASVQRYVPALRAEQLRFGPSGVRAQLVRPNGVLVDDFVLGGRERVLHVLNAPSPAATASLAIGDTLAGRAIERFGLRGV